MYNQPEIFPWVLASSPYGDCFIVQWVCIGYSVVYLTASKIPQCSNIVLSINANRIQGIHDFTHMIPCNRQEYGNIPRLTIYYNMETLTNHKGNPTNR